MITFIYRLIITALFCATLWAIGLGWFVTQIPRTPLPPETKADAVIVLTGGSGRVEYGLQLLANDQAKILFISGVGNEVSLADIVRQGDLVSRQVLEPVAQEKIILGREAFNTIGNADESVRWIKENNYHSILLVTANYHMPRSVAEFSEVMKDVAIIPAPVFTEHFSTTNWWIEKEVRPILLSEYHKFIAAKLRHLIVSQLQTS